MSSLPSSQETTLYSPRVTPRCFTNWQRVLTFAQSPRFVIYPLFNYCLDVDVFYFLFYLARMLSLYHKLSRSCYLVLESLSFLVTPSLVLHEEISLRTTQTVLLRHT